MRFPSGERRAHLARIARPIVDSSDAGLGPAPVVEIRLEAVRRNPNVGHAGGNAAPDVVQGPRLGDAGTLIECALFVPAGKTVRAECTKHMVTPKLSRRRSEDAERH